MIVDAVGVTETDLVETVPLDRKPTVSLDKLFKRISYGNRDPEVLSTIAGRLARLDRRLTKRATARRSRSLGGPSLQRDRARPRGRARPRIEPPGPGGRADARDRAATKQLLDEAVAPLAENPELRQRLLDIRRSYEQLLDEVSADELVAAGYSRDATERARATVDSFRQFIEENRDEIAALQILYSRPHVAAAHISERSRSWRTRSAGRRAHGRRRRSGGPTRRSTARRSTARATGS